MPDLRELLDESARGPQKPALLRVDAEAPNAGRILLEDVYGWFERVERGKRIAAEVSDRLESECLGLALRHQKDRGRSICKRRRVPRGNRSELSIEDRLELR